MRGSAGEHAGAIQRESAHPDKGRRISKQVYREKIGVLGWAPARVPHCELWIVAELSWVRWINLDCVQEPAADEAKDGCN